MKKWFFNKYFETLLISKKFKLDFKALTKLSKGISTPNILLSIRHNSSPALYLISGSVFSGNPMSFKIVKPQSKRKGSNNPVELNNSNFKKFVKLNSNFTKINQT